MWIFIPKQSPFLSKKSYKLIKSCFVGLSYTIQTPYILIINVKYIPIFIILDYCFYLLFTLYFYFHGQQVSYGYHDCITTTKSLDSFPLPKGSSENLFFSLFLYYIVAKWFEYSSVRYTSTSSIKLNYYPFLTIFSSLFRRFFSDELF